MIIDSHCHLDYEPMFSNLEAVLKRAKNSNVKFMLTISVSDKKYDNILIFNGFYSSSFLSFFNSKSFLKDFKINFLTPIEISS